MSPVAADATDPLLDLLAVDNRRADARRNGERIIAAALEVLAERGFEASIPEIAARAGVGRATVYRMFPSKASLLGAVAVYRYSPWIARLEQACEQGDPAETLRRVVGDLFAERASDRLILDALRNPPTPAAAAATARLGELLEGLLQAAQRTGSLRPDVSWAELRVLLAGCIHQLSRLGYSDPVTWRRYADLILDALRPGKDQ
jgi:AcrR family transcriptional regulator